MSEKKDYLTSGLLFLLVLLICFLVSFPFLGMRKAEPLFPGQGLREKKMLSSYFSGLENSTGDTEVYLYQGQEDGGKILILGGTHPNEPAGFICAVLLIENIQVSRGKVFIIPRANSSGFTHSEPHEGTPQYFALETAAGKRWFRYGTRLTNPVHQWPDPSLYVNPAGQKLSGSESRNLNRCYPGHEKGVLTEKVAHAIMEMIKEERIDLAIDLHEAAPEYPVINAIVFHENSAELAALALMELQAEGFDIRLEASPPNLRGLSHREWGDHSKAMAVLLETANASQGRLKGKPSESLIIDGKDKNYARAARLGRLFVPYPDEGIPLKLRVARHLAAIETLLSRLGEIHPEKAVALEGLPSPSSLIAEGVGSFLKPPK